MNKILLNYFGCSSSSDVVEPEFVPMSNDPFLASAKAATKFADTVNPVSEVTGMRMNDIDVALDCQDPALRNTLLKGLSKDVDPTQPDNSGLSDEDIATQALPRNLHVSDIVNASNELNDYENSLVEPELVPDPVPEPQLVSEPVKT